MSRATRETAGSLGARRRLLGWAILSMAVAFFLQKHSWTISLEEQWTPWANVRETAAAGDNLLTGVGFMSLGLLGLYFLLRRDGRSARFRGWLPLLAASYVFWCFASVCWSTDAARTIRYLGVLTFLGTAAMGMARQFAARDLLIAVTATLGAYCVIGVLTEMWLGAFHPLADGYRFAGTVHPNTQGAYMAVFCLAAFRLGRSREDSSKLLLAAFLLGVAFLLLTKSKTAGAGFLAGMGAMGLLELRASARVLVGAGIVVLIGCAGLAAEFMNVHLYPAAVAVLSAGREPGAGVFTGRIPVWAELSGYVGRCPLAGYGYQAFWTIDHVKAVSANLHWAVREAHCGYLESILSVGFGGTTLLLATVLLAMGRAARRHRESGDAGDCFVFGLLAFGVVVSFSESFMVTPGLLSLVAGWGVAYLAFYQEAGDGASPRDEDG